MDFGLGIHGEPGISSVAWMPATSWPRRWSRPCWPSDRRRARRAAVVVNGLGATKYEELFVLYGDVADLLVDAGVEIVAPEVGELVTSLDMAGCSLSLTWLDEELEGYWAAPADTPAFRRGTRGLDAVHRAPDAPEATSVARSPRRRATESVAAAAVARSAVAGASRSRRGEQGAPGPDRCDRRRRGSRHRDVTGSRAAAEAAATTEGGVQTVLAAAGAAFGDKAGGTSGILWGLLLDGVGKSLGNTEAGHHRAGRARRSQVSARDLQTFSKAELGDKTMLDALFPFVDTLGRAGRQAAQPLADAWTHGGGRLSTRRPRNRVAGPQDRPGPSAGRAQRGHPGPGRDLDGSDRDSDRRGARRGHLRCDTTTSKEE